MSILPDLWQCQPDSQQHNQKCQDDGLQRRHAFGLYDGSNDKWETGEQIVSLASKGLARNRKTHIAAPDPPKAEAKPIAATCSSGGRSFAAAITAEGKKGPMKYPTRAMATAET